MTTHRATRRPHPTRIVPAEAHNSIVWGVVIHLGPPVGFVLTLMWLGRTLPVIALAFIVISGLSMLAVYVTETYAPAAPLEPPDRDAIGFGLIVAFVQGVGLGGAVVFGVWWLGTRIWPYAEVWSGWWAVLTALALTDLAYYAIHRWLYHSRGRHPLLRWCRRVHARHHAVSHLDFLRGNVASLIDTAFTSFQVPLGVIAVIAGMGLIDTLIAYALVLMFQTTDHLNHTLNLGGLRHVFIDNHAHKLHHCKGGTRLNYAVVFTLWDRIFGSYHEDWSRSPAHMHRGRISVRTPAADALGESPD